MKQGIHKIDTGKNELLLVKIPADLHEFYLNEFGLTGKSFTDGKGIMRYIENICFDEPKSYRIVGKMVDLSNEKVAELIIKEPQMELVQSGNSSDNGPVYKNYNGDEIMISPWQSLYSCIEAHRLITTEPDLNVMMTSDYLKAMEKYIDPSQTMILKKQRF